MGTPTQHAFLSASSAHRWLVCTASPHFEAQFEDSTSVYAEEGTLAHHICELYATRAFKSQEMSSQKFGAHLKKAKQNELFNDEMLNCAQKYVEYLKLKSMELYNNPPHISQEVQVNFSAYVPEGFGTCDCIMIGENTLHITDYKHGKGVKVSAERNPQMMLYALGALELYKVLYKIDFVSMAIFQPRISEEPSEYKMRVDELLHWGESIKPLAQAAFTGNGAEVKPGEHCRFCKGKAKCRKRAEQNTALEEFKDCAIAGKAAPELQQLSETAKRAIDMPRMLTDNEIGELLVRGANLVQWYEDIKEYATRALLEGKEIPGWKVVEGKSNRKITDADALIKTLVANGTEEVLCYEKKPLSLTEFEKLVGKKEFNSLCSEFVVKPQGKPTLVPLSDKREPFNSAKSDFAGVNNTN